MTPPPAYIQLALVAMVTIAALWDLRFRRIPNWLTASGVVAGLAIQAGLGGWAGLRSAAFGLGLALLVYLPLFLLRAMGGGDVKLMAAVGAFLGPKNWIVAFLLISIAGGLIALLLALIKGRLSRTLHNVSIILSDLVRLRAPYGRNPELDVTSGAGITLPRGVVIALGTFAFLALARLLAE